MHRYSTPNEQIAVFGTWTVDRMSQSEAVDRAIALYETLPERLRGTEWWTDAVAEEFALGQAKLDTLRLTATALPLSRGADELLTSYLAGPNPDDIEAAHAWVTLLPELMVDVMGAEKQQNARTLQAQWFVSPGVFVSEPTWQFTEFWTRIIAFDVVKAHETERLTTLKFKFGTTAGQELRTLNTQLRFEHRVSEARPELDAPAGNRQPALALAA